MFIGKPLNHDEVDNHPCPPEYLGWDATVVNNSLVQDGLLKMHDVQAAMVLGCDHCSDTLAVLDFDAFVAYFRTRGVAIPLAS